jgi:hypothetical protein
VTIVVVEWDDTDATPPPRPHRLTRELLPLRAGAIECFAGGGGTVQFTERGRVFGAYVLLGEEAPRSLADDARSTLDTLKVAPR